MNDQTKPDDAVTLGDRRVEITTVERYKGIRGKTDRVGIISSALLRAYSYFYEGQGGRKILFRAPTNPETLKYVKDTLGEPTQRFGLLLFHYLTDDKGELVDTEKLRGKLKTWAVSETRYEELSGINKQWPLLDTIDPVTNTGFGNKQHDLMVTCSEERFQRMTFVVTPTAHWKSKQQWYDAVKSREVKAKERLRWALGRELKDSEIMALLGGGSTAAAGDSAGDVDLSDILGDDPPF